jgi:DNA-binding transcriptional MerR regulator
MERLYYSISEVSEMLNINASNLRFWEKEFKQLKPRRNEKGTRFYTNDDIELIKQIIFLVNEQNLTLEGARQKLTQKRDRVAKQQKLAERLRKIRAELAGMSKALNPI